MNPVSDTRFLDLAMKALAGRCAAEERAELDRILLEEPKRASEFATLEKEHQVVAKVIPFLAAVEAHPVPVPEKALERLRNAVLRKYGPATVAAVVLKPLSSKEMEVVALRILSERPMDGFDFAASLRKAGMKSKEGGEGTLYGALSRLESSGHLEGRWRPRGARMVKTYHLTEKGTGSLRKSSALAGQFESLCQAAMKFDPTAG